MTLHDRCIEFMSKSFDSEDIRDFVLAEIGRAASDTLSESSALVLYFANDAERKELTRLLVQENPHMISRKWPHE